MLNNKPITLKAWSKNFDFSANVLTTIPIWVKFHNLPLNCWIQGALSRINSALGNPLFPDDCTIKVDRISYACVLIEMNATQILPKVLSVKDPSGRMFERKLEYN